MDVENSRRAHDIKKRIAEILPKGVAEKWEGRIRRKTLENGGFAALNEMVSFNVYPDSPDEVALHIHENLTKSPIEANKLMLLGLKALANRLKTDPELANIQIVSGYSWIVYNSPGIMRLLGFKVSGLNHNKKTALATMNKDSFVSRFGT